MDLQPLEKAERVEDQYLDALDETNRRIDEAKGGLGEIDTGKHASLPRDDGGGRPGGSGR